MKRGGVNEQKTETEKFALARPDPDRGGFFAGQGSVLTGQTAHKEKGTATGANE